MTTCRRSLSFPDPVRTAVRAGSDHFIVTGAGGWLGKATLEMLDEALGEELGTRVLAFARTRRVESLHSGRNIILLPLADLEQVAISSRRRHLVHFAFLTREKVSSTGFDDYVCENRRVTKFVVEQGMRLSVRGTFSTSSGAVYRKDRTLEDNLVANPYGFLKLEEEATFAQLSAKLGSRAQICRVFNLSGPFLNKEYAIGSMLADVLAHRPISIRAPNPVIRSYAHVRDVVSVGFAGMLGVVEPATRPYDTAGEEEVELYALAERIRTVLSCPELKIVRPARSGSPDRYVGDGRVFASMAKRLDGGLATLNEQIAATAQYLEQTVEVAPGA